MEVDPPVGIFLHEHLERRTPLATSAPPQRSQHQNLIAHAPALPVALAAWGGVWLGFGASYLPVVPLAVLVALPFSVRRKWGPVVAVGALGLLLVAVGEGVVKPDAVVAEGLPVTAVVRPLEPPRAGRFSWSVPVAVVSLRQGGQVMAPPWPRRVLLSLPEPEVPFPAARTLRVRGYLRPVVGFANRPRESSRGRSAWENRLTVKSRRLVAVITAPSRIERASAALRAKVLGALEAVEEGRADGRESPGLILTRALVLGERGQVPASWRRGLERQGLAHLLAVSGLHVGLMAVLAWLLGSLLTPRRWRHLRWPRLGAPMVAVASYLLLVGPRPSLLRASTMALLALLAQALRRPPSGGNALALFVLVALAGRPSLVHDLGFCLSVGATGALVWGAPRLEAAWSDAAGLPGGTGGWRGAVRRSLAATTTAQLGTLPWALPAFHLLVPTAPLSNLMALPWAVVMLAAGVSWCGVACLHPATAASLLPLLDGLAAPVPALAAWRPGGWGALPWSTTLPGVPEGVLGIALALALAAVLLRPRRGVPLLLLALTVGWCGVPEAGEGPELLLLDVGQGDAVLIKDGDRAILVDGGGDFAGRALVPALAAEGIWRLDGMVVSHPDRDHCGGLRVLADFFPVRKVYSAVFSWDEGSECGQWLTAARRRGQHRPLVPGDHLAVGRWRLEILHPPPSGVLESRGKDPKGNDRSLVFVATAPGGRRVLLTGDIEAVAERRLLSDPEALACDVLKVAHHGSQTSSTARFLAAARPRLALLSSGRDNPYHHPSPKVVRRLERAGVHVLRTDHHGRVRLLFREDGTMVTTTIALPGKDGARVD
jgi:competence protein ComEC